MVNFVDQLRQLMSSEIIRAEVHGHQSIFSVFGKNAEKTP